MAASGERDKSRALRRDLGALRAAVAAHRTERARAVNAVATINAQLAAVEARIAALTVSGDRDAAEGERQARARLLERRAQGFARLRELDDDVRAVIGRLHANIDPCDADPVAPLLLLPVRLETRYTEDRMALRVRIFPDDVHIDALDRGMTAAEQVAALDYWTVVWRASDADAATAWRDLIARVGKDRAPWVALGSEPANLASRTTDATPELPKIPAATRRAAVARLLPDAFTVVALQGGVRSTVTGRPIAPEVVVGALSADSTPLKMVGDARVVEGAEWLVDYDEAVRIGMGMTLPLQHPGAAVDQLFAFGVRRSLDPTRGAPAELADLLRAHRCTGGLAFLPQGTPSNNTETDRAGWQQRIEPSQPARDAPAAPAAGTNAAVLGDALGIDPRVLAEVEHAQDAEQPHARAMNVALWGPSWGSFLERAQHVGSKGPTLTDAACEATRTFHRDFVRGRGPLPAIRVGDQPYGVLPVSRLADAWKTPQGDRFETELLLRLRRLRAKWASCVAAVPRVGEGPVDQATTDMLASAPVSFSVRVRSVLSGDFASIATQATGASPADLEIEALIESLVWEEINNASLTHPPGSLAAQSRPLQLPYVDDSDPAFIDALMAGTPPPPASVLQALLALAWDSARRAADKEAADGRLAEIVGSSQRISEASRERVLALAAGATEAQPTHFYAEAARFAREVDVRPATLAAYQPIPAVRRSFGEMALASTSVAAREELVVHAVLGWLYARGRFNELRDALQLLKTTGKDERRILVAETLDTASHRLDAWLTGIVERRRAALRARQPGTVNIGAYGWVEHVEPTGLRAPDGGYVHAPSLTHAATAGILRSAYLSHNPDGGGDGAFAVDLASARVRLACELQDGIRQGQPLPALLGYRIERELHDAGADRLIFSLRAIAPLTQGKLTGRNDTLPPKAVEAIAASNVVDGIDLVAKYQGKVTGFDPGIIRKLLDQRPADNPYLQGLVWPPVSKIESDALDSAIKHAAAAIDAVGDLLLAEGVHQLVQGNVARAAAAMDAASSGDSAPPEPDFIATPALGVPIVHQLLVVANGGTPWNLARPRAAAEPRLEAWAGALLGDPATIIVAQRTGGARVAAAASGLCALDLVYDAADRRLFEQRLRTALTVAGESLPDALPLADAPDPGWPGQLRAIGDIFELAASLRTLLSRARPAAATDLALPNHPPTRSVDPAELAAAHLRAAAATGALSAHGQALQALVDAKVTDPAALLAALEPLAGFGVAVPLLESDRLAVVAALAASEAARRVLDANEQLKTVTIESVTQCGQTLFGDGFWILAAVAGGVGSDSWDTAFATLPDGASASGVRRFLTDQASVRDGARRLVEAQLLAEAVGVAPLWRVGQMVGGNGTAPRRWIAAPLAADEPTPTASVVNTVLAASSAMDATAPVCALVVDQWTEVLPLREARGEDAALVDARHTSGIALNANAPGARAPQALLLAISPDGERWNVDRVVAVLQETLELARLRLVTLERTNGIARLLPALYEQSWSLQGEQVFNPRFVDKAARIDELATFMKERP
jgi:hypothetical protein